MPTDNSTTPLSPEDAAFLEQYKQSPIQAAPGAPPLSAEDSAFLAQQPKASSGTDPFSLAPKDQVAIANEYGWNPATAAFQRKLQGNPLSPEEVERAAETKELLRQQGITGKDLSEAAKGALPSLWRMAKGFTLYGAQEADTISKVVAGQLFGDEQMKKEAAAKQAELTSASEASVLGLTRLAKQAGEKLFKRVTPFTREEKIQRLFDEMGYHEQQHNISQGKGAFLQGVEQGAQALGKASLPTSTLESAAQAVGTTPSLEPKTVTEEAPAVRPERVEELAAGEPLGLYVFQKGFKLAPVAVKAVAPELPAATAALGAKAARAMEVGTGKVLQGGTAALDWTTKNAARIAPITGGIAGAIKGAAYEGEIPFVTPGAATAGYMAGEKLAKVLEKTPALTRPIKEIGEELVTGAPAKSNVTQLARDVIQGAPGLATSVGEGALIDIGMMAAGETPEERRAAGMGASFGAIAGLHGMARRVISGQLIAPRAVVNPGAIKSLGQFPGLEALHQETMRSPNTPPGQVARVNALRKFVQDTTGGDLFFTTDKEALADALGKTKLVDPVTGKPRATAGDEAAQERGFFTREIIGADGQPKRVIILTDSDVAPHEAIHALDDVMGETANRAFDDYLKRQYTPEQWEQLGKNYTQSENWREDINRKSGWLPSEAFEKLFAQYAQSQGHGNVKQMTAERWNQLLDANGGNEVATARSILTPEEQAAMADRYLAREVKAEAGDALLKASPGMDFKGPKGILPGLAKVLGTMISMTGGEPLAGRSSEALGLPLEQDIVTAVGENIRGNVPEVAAKGGKAGEVTAPTVKARPVGGVPVTQQQQDDAAAQAAQIAAEAPTAIAPGGTRSARELLGAAAEAIARRQGLKINYLSAPDEPAAATTSNRTVRRNIIEAFRSMPTSARALWEKTIFPERIIKTKTGYQVMGWAPEVFASNAHKVAQTLNEIGRADLSPYPLDPKTGSFTADGWQKLYEDTQKFVQNQKGGRTGSGEELVVPREVTERGFTAPEVSGSAAGIDQRTADFINMLYNFKLPETPRIQKGKLPLNIAGQEISAATLPGRVEVPVRPRGEFKGPEAQAQSIEGREISEVNPVRNEIEAAAQKAGKPMPSFIEAIQKLNLENIKEAEVAPEVPEFRGNTLTLSAGFAPKENYDRIATKMPGDREENLKAAALLNKGFTRDEYLGMEYPVQKRIRQLLRRANEEGINKPWSETNPKYGVGGQFAPEKFKVNPDHSWLDPEGNFHPGLRDHAYAAKQITGIENPADAYANLIGNGWLRVRREGNTLWASGQGPEPLTQAQKSALEMAGIENDVAVKHDIRTGVPRVVFTPPVAAEAAMQFSPSKDPRAVKEAAVKDTEGRIWTGSYHGEAEEKGRRLGAKFSFKGNDDGYVTNGGEFLDREAAYARAQELNQVRPGEAETMEGNRRLEALGFLQEQERNLPPGERQYSPAKKMEDLMSMTPEQLQSYKGKYSGGLTGWAWDVGASAKTADDLQALARTHSVLTDLSREAFKNKDIAQAMELGQKASAAREAYEAATGHQINAPDKPADTALKLLRQADPNYEPPMSPARQAAPPSYTDEQVREIKGGTTSRPAVTYKEASDSGFERKQNPWVRRSADPALDQNPSNEGRVLLVQIASDLMNPPGRTNMELSTPYYDKVYGGAREGYTRMDDFWEIPQWMGFASHIFPNADVYVIRDMAQANKFFNEAGYDRLMFSAMDVNKAFIKDVAANYKGKVDVGGWIDKKYFADNPNVTWHDSLEAMAKHADIPYKNGVDYRHFTGSESIPRLNMSTGCKYQCAFCTVEKAVVNVPNDVITQQAEEIAKLGTDLIYLGDKTFGQAKNYEQLATLKEKVQAINPNFKGFVVQTTASQLPKLSSEWLKKSGIKFVELGIETYNDPILRAVQKPATESLMDKSVAVLRENGITLIPNIIIGLPGEDAATYDRTLTFLKNNADIISHANIYNLAIYEDAKLAKEITTASPDDFNENVLEKSFHTDPNVHRQFAGDVYGLATRMLEKKPVTMQGAPQAEPPHIRDATDLWESAAAAGAAENRLPRQSMFVPDRFYTDRGLAVPEQKEEVEPLRGGVQTEKEIKDAAAAELPKQEAPRRKKESRAPGNYWIAKGGALHDASFDHFDPDSPLLPKGLDPKTVQRSEFYERMFDDGHLRVSDRGDLAPTFVEGSYPTWADVPRKAKQGIEDARFSKGKQDTELVYNDTIIYGQMSPRKRKEEAVDYSKYNVVPKVAKPADKKWELQPGSEGFSKAWILPNGEPEQLGGQWHHAWLNANPEIRDKYGISETDSSEANRVEALKKGFARINYDTRSGKLTVEARQKDWRRLVPVIEKFVDKNVDKVDSMTVNLTNDTATKSVNSDTRSLFEFKAAEKMQNLPLITASEPSGQYAPPFKAKEFSDELDKVKSGEAFGQTFNPDGTVWQPEGPSDIVTLASVNLPKDKLTADAVRTALAPYEKLLRNKNVAAGVFSMPDGKTVSIDLNAVVPQAHRENSIAFAKGNNQVSIWDAAKQEEVKTGGTGDTVLKTPEDIEAALPKLVAGQAAPKAALSSVEIGDMTKQETADYYPESVIPKKHLEFIPSKIMESPLAKEAGSEKAAVEAYGKKLLEEAKANMEDPTFQAGKTWYSEFSKRLNDTFGKDAQVFAELLAATSPNTAVAPNFKFAFDALRSNQEGRFDSIKPKFMEGLQKIEDGSWKEWYEANKGMLEKEPKKPGPGTFLAMWVDANDLKPRQSNGSLYGIHSLGVLQVLARKWLTDARGPKTLNFVKNLLGTGHEATIDVWADRTLRRIGYAPFIKRWRILSKNNTAPSPKEFEFSQKAFRYAADELGWEPDALQAAMWFAEKKLWAENGWTRLDLGDFSTELKKVPDLEQEYQQRTAQKELDLIQPKRTK